MIFGIDLTMSAIAASFNSPARKAKFATTFCLTDSNTVTSGIDPNGPIGPRESCSSECVSASGPILWADPGLRTAESAQKIGPRPGYYQKGSRGLGPIGPIGPILELHGEPRIVRAPTPAASALVGSQKASTS